MVSTVNQMIGSADLGSGNGLIPVEYATQIIQDAPKQSVIMSRARTVRMSTKTRTQPVLDSKPIAYWVGGETGLKQTTKMKWSGLTITAEELEDCRRSLLSGMAGIEDTLGGIETWYYMEVLRGGPVQTPDDARAALQAVTEEDVRTVLRQLTLSVSYLLTREEESAHA